MDIDLQTVVSEIAPSMFRLAFSFCGSRADAEDAVQEVLLKYLRVHRSFDSLDETRRYLMTATANQCRDLLKSPERRRCCALEACEPVQGITEDTDVRLEVEQALRSLEPKYRSVIYLFYYEDYTVAQIAATLGVTRTAVTTRLNRARKQLKTLLGGDEDEAKR